jgi:hypothetical protein
MRTSRARTMAPDALVTPRPSSSKPSAVSSSKPSAEDASAERSSITVLVRVRPLKAQEGRGSVWTHDDRSIWQTAPSSGRLQIQRTAPYTFDRVFGENEGTSSLHKESVANLVDRATQGFNATVFAYGQTSSGKTTTIRGARSDDGLIALAVRRLFTRIDTDDEPSRWSVTLSYMEIYNEVLGDLLTGSTGLQIFETKGGRLRVEHLKEMPITCWADAEAALLMGDSKRHINATPNNERSSRAHVVCRLSINKSATAQDPDFWCASSSLIHPARLPARPPLPKRPSPPDVACPLTAAHRSSTWWTLPDRSG